MSGKTGGEKGNGEREPVSVTVTLPAALVEYFREGDMSH